MGDDRVVGDGVDLAVTEESGRVSLGDRDLGRSRSRRSGRDLQRERRPARQRRVDLVERLLEGQADRLLVDDARLGKAPADAAWPGCRPSRSCLPGRRRPRRPGCGIRRTTTR